MRIFVVCITLVLCRLSASQTSTMQNVSVHGNCNFAIPSFPHRNEMKAYIMTPESSTMLDIINCKVWYNSSRGILRLWLQKTSNKTKTSLISTVLDEQGVLVLPGYVAEAEEEVTYPFHICPSLAESTSRNYSIFLSAPPLTGRISYGNST